MNIKDMKIYYGSRAKVYDHSMYFNKPERNNEITKMASLQKKLFKNKTIIEVASGPGYWTEIISHTARKIYATDVVSETITEARKKKYFCPVEFICADAFDLPFKEAYFNAGFANFWISHILKKDLKKFLDDFHALLKPGSIVFFCDNATSQGASGKFIKRANDTFQVRKLQGKSYDVIKNYYQKEDLIKLFKSYAKKEKLTVEMGDWAWWVWYKSK